KNDLPAGQTFSVSYQYYPVSQSKLVNGEDGNSTFNGMRIFVTKDTLGVERKNSGWLPGRANNFRDTIIWVPRTVSGAAPHLPTDLDFKIEFTSMDTTADGKFVTPGDTVLSQPLNRPIVCPFKITIATQDSMLGRKADYFIFEGVTATRNNSKWDLGENIIFFPRVRTGIRTSYQIDFNLPKTGTTPVYPKAGDAYFLRTTKPFKKGDVYSFRTKAETYDKTAAKSALANVYVVPNPYVAFSEAEEPAKLPNRRGEQQIQFRNLPRECTVRIYTITGELVETLRKNDDSSILGWNLLSYEGQRIAYGVYIYHVDAPGIGEKVGRFAVIK
ncbi:MAG: hypothetical protein KJ666_06875, partial [Bacteroidetes bacterium]|nr:hypothetical protein [Bacteroidota bacterium]